MTNVTFLKEKNLIIGFSVYGHSSVDADDCEGKIICSAVSSAAYLTANTVLEVICADANIDIDDAKMSLKLMSKVDECQVTLKGFYIHCKQLSEQYPDNITIITEV